MLDNMNIIKKRGQGLSLRSKDIITGYGFLSLWILGFAVFTAYPFVYSLYLSFSNVKVGVRGIQTSPAGLYWYKEVLLADPDFIPALKDTLKFICFSSPVIIVVALIIAVFLNNKFMGRSFFRTMFFFPVVIISGPVIIEFMANKATNVANPYQYEIYSLIASLPGIIAEPLTYAIEHIVLILWFSGVQIQIYLSGLQKIGKPIYDAARIDGASQWEIFWKIVLPHIKPLILVNAIYTVIEFAVFPTTRVNILIEERMFTANIIYSYSAAISWIFFVVQILPSSPQSQPFEPRSQIHSLLLCLSLLPSKQDQAAWDGFLRVRLHPPSCNLKQNCRPDNVQSAPSIL
jgi:oligogalacturonide transport system permease protein